MIKKIFYLFIYLFKKKRKAGTSKNKRTAMNWNHDD